MTSIELSAVGAICVIVAWNAFFVAAEFSFVAVRHTRIAELAAAGSRRARRVARITADPTRFIAGIQVAVTLSSLALGAVGEPIVAGLLERVFGVDDTAGLTVAAVVSVVVAFMVISSVHVVFGEIVPKTLTLARAEQVALVAAGPVLAFMWLFWPLIRLLEGISAGVIRLLGLEQPAALRLVHSEEELKMLISASHEEGVLEDDEQQLLHKVFGFSHTEVRQVMVPRPDIVALPAQMTRSEAITQTGGQPYTRYPVYRDGLDDLIGVIHLRDLFQPVAGDDPTLETVARNLAIVPETKMLGDLLLQFRRDKTHMAAVLDEYGSTVGIVTLEDVIEEIVGEISDEFDPPDRALVELAPGHLQVAGALAIEEFNAEVALDLPNGSYTSVGGFVFGQLGRPGRVGDIVDYAGTRFTIREMVGSRIRMLDVQLPSAGD